MFHSLLWRLIFADGLCLFKQPRSDIASVEVGNSPHFKLVSNSLFPHSHYFKNAQL